MTTLASDNFDSDTTGTIAPGFTAIASSTWVVGTTSPVSGAKSFGCTAGGNGAKCVYTAGSVTQANQTVAVNFKWAASPIGVMARSNAAGSTQYAALPGAGTMNIFSIVGGSPTNIKAGTFTTPTVGDSCTLELLCVSTLIEARIWNNTLGQTRPATATASVTSSSIAAGTAGLYNQSAGLLSVDDFVWTDAVVAATAVTVTGWSGAAPTTGNTGQPSDAYMLALNGSGTGNVTLSDGAAGGTFYPSATVAIANGGTAFVSYTKPASGAATISFTNDAGLTNPGNVTYTASSTKVMQPVTTAAITWSPFNWDPLAAGVDFNVPVVGKQTACCGAYLKFKITGTTTLGLAIDATQYLPPFAAATAPRLEYRVLSMTAGTASLLARGQLTIGQATVGLGAGMTTGSVYEVEVTLLGTSQVVGDRGGSSGVSPTDILRLFGVVADSGATISLHSSIRPNKHLCLMDSIGEGVRAAGITTDVLDHDHSLPYYMARGMNCEMGTVAFGGSSWTAAGTLNGPAGSSLANHSAGRARDLTACTACYVSFGANGSTSAVVQTFLAAARAALPANCPIYVIMNIGGLGTTQNAAGVAAYLAAHTSEVNIHTIDTSSRIETKLYDNTNGAATPGSVDGEHPLTFDHGLWASAATSLIQQSIDGVPPATSARTVTLTLTDNAGVVRPNLTGINWALFANGKPNLLLAPDSKGTGATTDSSGVMTLSVQSSLASGSTASLLLGDGDGTYQQSPPPDATYITVQVI